MTDYNLIVSPKALGASKKAPMVITRKVEFSASHVCRDPKLSDEENQRIYGLAANPHGHGHNYVVEVSAGGRARPGDRDGAGSEGVEGDSDARDCGALRSPFSELRSAAFRPGGADDGEYRARHLAAAGAAAERRAAGNCTRSGCTRRRTCTWIISESQRVPRNPAVRICGLASIAFRRIERGREPAVVREVQQSVRPRAQLRGGSERARAARPGDRAGGGSAGAGRAGEAGSG